MAKIEDTRQAPYYDDYDETKQFYRVLFRPSFAVQARELTQLQTIFQKQIERIGDFLFREGAMVVPGHATLDRNYNYIRLIAENDNQLDDEDYIKNTLIDAFITGDDSEVEAKVVNYLPVNNSNHVYLYIKYTSGGVNGQNIFLDGEIIRIKNTNTVFRSTTTGATGRGIGASIRNGVYYTKGFLAIVGSQDLVVSRDTTDPSVRIGLNVTVSIVAPEEDESLLDNAQGVSNESAPGATRLKIDLALATQPITSVGDPTVNENFIELIRLEKGLVVKKVETTDLGIIKNTLARRTFDESGHYTVRPFLAEKLEFYRENNNDGFYSDEDFEKTTQTEAEAIGQRVLELSGWHVSPNDPSKFLPGPDNQAYLDAVRSKFIYSFSKGKAYVFGNEIETFGGQRVVANKSRATQEQNNQIVRPAFGNALKLNIISGQPSLGFAGGESFKVVELHERRIGNISTSTKIGTARISYLKFEQGTPNTSSAVYRASIFDVQLDPQRSINSVQSLYMAANGRYPVFEANVFLREVPFFGATATNSGSSRTIEGINAYWRTTDTQALVRNNTIKLTPNDPTLSEVYGYVERTPFSNLNLTLQDPVDLSAGEYSVSRVYTEVDDTESSVYIFPLGNERVKTLIPSGGYDVTYTAQQQFESDKTGDTYTIQVPNAPIGTNNVEEFDAFSSVEWHIVGITGTTGTPVAVQSSQVVLTNNNTRATITIAGSNFDKLLVIAPIIKKIEPGTSFKNKIPVIGDVNTGLNTGEETDLKTISMNRADVIRIKHIYMANGFAPNAFGSLTQAQIELLPDIANRYVLDSGVRDTHYDIASLILRPGAQTPTGSLLVVYDYYSHGTTGNFFCINSYQGTEYADIPNYESLQSGTSYPLTDVLDFRPTLALVGNEKQFVNSNGGSISFMPASPIAVDYEYYLNRRDRIFVDADGRFGIVEGTPAIEPVYPADPADAMVIYDAQIKAFTKSTDEVYLKKRENKRYTMRDIGRLENRINNLEYYTSLSLLEKDTNDLVVRDAEGNEKFKHGFIVDPFTGHQVGDTTSPDYRCSIDVEGSFLRPPFYENKISLRETFVNPADATSYTGFDGITGDERNQRGYVKTGDLITLAYQPIDYITQLAASRTVNVNPYNVFRFIGDLKLTPELDDWKGQKTLPPQVIEQDDGTFDALTKEAEAMGTIYGAWQEERRVLRDLKQEVTTQVETFPGPAFHFVNGEPNEAMLELQERERFQDRVIKLEKVRANIKGQLQQDISRKERKRLEARLKKNGERLKEARQKASAEPVAQNTFPIRINTTTKTIQTTQISRSRNVIKPKVTEARSEVDLGDRVVGISIAERMRPVIILFEARLLKPNTELYCFFDGKRVDQRVVALDIVDPSIKELVDSNFTVKQTGETLEQFRQTLIDGGYLNNSVERPTRGNTTDRTLLVPVGNGHRIDQEVPNSSASVLRLITNAEGKAYGIFISTGDFKTGAKRFKVSSSPVDAVDADTFAGAFFESRGLVEQRQQQILSTRSAVLTLEQATEVDDNVRVEQQVVDTDFQVGQWEDPIAQSFLVSEKEGVYVTSVSVYFATKDDTIPVRCQLRQMRDGSPTGIVIPFGEAVLEPSEVNLNVVNASGGDPDLIDRVRDKLAATSGFVPLPDQTYTLSTVSGGTTNNVGATFRPDTDFIPTTFTFSSPVYLAPGEYCFVLLSNSDAYEMWTYASQGVTGTPEPVIGTNLPVSGQPYAGVMFKSQNASTWTPDQTQDVMFKIQRAQFNTAPATITLVNEELPYEYMSPGSFKTVEGSNIVVVTHENHGFRTFGDSRGNRPRVKFRNIDETIGGINPAYINNDPTNVDDYHEVYVIDLNRYFIEITDEFGTPVNASETNFTAGGSNVLVTSDIQVDEMILDVATVVPRESSLNFGYRITSGSAVHDPQSTPYVIPSDVLDYKSIQTGERIIFDSPKLIASLPNEITDSVYGSLISGAPDAQGSKSLFIDVVMSTNVDTVSPVIDTAKMSVLTIGNLIDDPGLGNEYTAYSDPTDLIIPGFVDNVSGVTSVTADGLADDVTMEVTITGGSYTVEDIMPVGSYVLVAGNLRKVDLVSGTQVTVDRPFANDFTGATVAYSTSDEVAFGDSVEELLETGTPEASVIEFFPDTNSIGINGPFDEARQIARAILESLVDDEAITITTSGNAWGAGEVSQTFRIVRKLSTADSFELFFDIETGAPVLDPSQTGTSADTVISRIVNSLKITNDQIAEELNRFISVGKYIEVTNSNPLSLNSQTMRIVNFDYDSGNKDLEIYVDYLVEPQPIGNPLSVVLIDSFLHQTAPLNGTANAKYLTRSMVLKNAANSLQVRFDANTQEGVFIETYARFLRVDDNRPITEIPYREMLLDQAYVKPNTPNVFTEHKYTEEFLPPFKAVQVKIVLYSNDTTKVPRVKDLSITALES